MKTANFPARKLARQIAADIRSANQGSSNGLASISAQTIWDQTCQAADYFREELQRARSIRTKIYRGN